MSAVINNMASKVCWMQFKKNGTNLSIFNAEFLEGKYSKDIMNVH